MLKQLNGLKRGLQEGIREFRRSSSEIQDEISNAIDLYPAEETDGRIMRFVILCFALLALHLPVARPFPFTLICRVRGNRLYMEVK